MYDLTYLFSRGITIIVECAFGFWLMCLVSILAMLESMWSNHSPGGKLHYSKFLTGKRDKSWNLDTVKLDRVRQLDMVDLEAFAEPCRSLLMLYADLFHYVE